MEDLNSPELKQWVDAENALAFAYLNALPQRDALKARITELSNYAKVTPPQYEGGRWFYSRNSGLQRQSVVFMREALNGPETVVLDPNRLSPDGSIALSAFVPAPDGRHFAYGQSQGGSDWSTYYVRDEERDRDGASRRRKNRRECPGRRRRRSAFPHARRHAGGSDHHSRSRLGHRPVRTVRTTRDLLHVHVAAVPPHRVPFRSHERKQHAVRGTDDDLRSRTLCDRACIDRVKGRHPRAGVDHPSHSFKFGAALQAAQGCDKPVLIRIETQASHAYRPTDKRIAELADQWAFALANMQAHAAETPAR